MLIKEDHRRWDHQISTGIGQVAQVPATDFYYWQPFITTSKEWQVSLHLGWSFTTKPATLHLHYHVHFLRLHSHVKKYFSNISGLALIHFIVPIWPGSCVFSAFFQDFIANINNSEWAQIGFRVWVESEYTLSWTRIHLNSDWARTPLRFQVHFRLDSESSDWTRIPLGQGGECKVLMHSHIFLPEHSHLH